MWEKALTQAISRSSTWDLVIGLIAILMFRLVSKMHESDDTVKTKGSPKADKVDVLMALKYMLILGLSTLAARVTITIANFAFN